MTNMNDQFKVIRREGKILERFDWENDKGCNSAGSMSNGKGLSIEPQCVTVKW